jgi:hypothetical protein
MDLKLLACFGPDTNINSKEKSFQNTKFIENITSDLSKDATQVASGRTAPRLLQMAAEATDQIVKEITLLQIVLLNFMKRHIKKKFKIFSQFASAYQIGWVPTRRVQYL